MSAEIAELQRRLANLFRVGKVAEIDRDTMRVKVAFNGVTSPWMPWQTARAGAVKTWSPPAVGEQVCIISPFGELGSGFVMGGAINYDDQAAPDNRENVEKITLPSGGAYEIHVGSNVLTIAGGKLTFTGDVEITGKITATGDIITPADVKAASISLKSHVHGGVEPGGATTGQPA
jgi:phage baseplate assembly protein gpV